MKKIKKWHSNQRDEKETKVTLTNLIKNNKQINKSVNKQKM